LSQYSTDDNSDGNTNSQEKEKLERLVAHQRERRRRHRNKRKQEREAKDITSGVRAGGFVGNSATTAGGSFRVVDFFAAYAARTRFFEPTAFVATASDIIFGGTFGARGLGAPCCCECLDPWWLSLSLSLSRVANNAFEKEYETCMKNR
jgi:hypothetical protein